MSFLIVVITTIAVRIPPAPEYKNNEAFYDCLQSAVADCFREPHRLLVRREFANSFTLAKLKVLIGGRFLWTRTIGSTVVGQAVDTTHCDLHRFLGRPGQPRHVIGRLILSGYLIKVVWLRRY